MKPQIELVAAKIKSVKSYSKIAPDSLDTINESAGEDVEETIHQKLGQYTNDDPNSARV